MRPWQIISSIAALLFAAAAMASGIDRLSNSTPGLERLVPGPFRAQADRAAAATYIARQEVGPALVYARAAVRSDPIDPDATPLLGTALRMSEELDEADRVFRIAARYGWRNLETQSYWYDVAFAVGDYEVAADRVDAILRTRPRLVSELSILEPMENEPAATTILARRLESKPAWLEPYLRPPIDADPELFERRYRVVSQIKVSRLKIDCDVIAPFSRTLLASGRRSDAMQLWNRHCPQKRAGAILGDSTFAEAQLGLEQLNPFSWRALPSGDVSFRSQGAGNEASLVVTNTAPVSRLILIQPAAFPPGLYRIRLDVQEADGLRPARLQLTWNCDGRPPFPHDTRGDPLVDGQVLSFTSCKQQQLGLWLEGGGKSVALRSIRFEKIT